MKELEDACIERVRSRFVPELERIAGESLGERPGGKAWMEFQVDGATHSPVVLFHYPTNEPTGFEYLGRSVIWQSPGHSALCRRIHAWMNWSGTIRR